MKKNPLLLLLGISGAFFLVFIVFVMFALGSFVKDGARSPIHLGANENIGILPINGAIMDGTKILKQLKKLEEDDSIKGIIVRINSPGGAVAPSQEIHDAILTVRKAKPVIASFDSLAASGGYYVAVATQKIVTNPGTLTGSIGVIMDFINLSDLYKWAKVERYNLKSGKFKDTGNDARPMTPEERELMQGTINNVYGQFVKAVATGRNLPEDKVRELADGRIYTGEQAFQLGLADKLGGLEVAVELMKELAGIKGKPELVYPEPKRKKFLDAFVEGLSKNLISAVVNQLKPTDASNAQGFALPKNGKTLYFF